MRTISILLTGLLILSNISAQLPDTLTAEMFSNMPGKIIEKQFVSVGNVDEIDVRLMKVKDISSGTTMYSVRMEYFIQGEIMAHAKVGNIECKEIDGIVMAISAIKEELLIDTGEDFKEITYRCKSGLVLGAFFDEKGKKWTTYIQLNRNDPHSTINIEKEEFDQLRTLLQKVKTMTAQ